MMFRQKIMVGSIIGGILGVMALIGCIRDNKPWNDILSAIPIGVIVGIGGTFWFTRDSNNRGGYVRSDVDDLREKLRKATYLLQDAIAQGNRTGISHWQAEVSIIESKLRSRGA